MPTHHATWTWPPLLPGPLCPLRLWPWGRALRMPAPPTVGSRCFLGKYWGREKNQVCLRKHCFLGSLTVSPVPQEPLGTAHQLTRTPY